MRLSLPSVFGKKSGAVIFHNKRMHLGQYAETTNVYPKRRKEYKNGIEDDWDLFERGTGLKFIGSRSCPQGRGIATLMSEQGEMFETFYSCSWNGTKSISW